MRIKQAQAAMEFLMTYGWALLIVLIAIGALAFFGVLNHERFVPKSDSDIRGECMQTFYDPIQENKHICAEIVCPEFGLTQSSISNWYYTVVECNSQSGATIDIDICNTNIDSCKILCKGILDVQNCAIEKGAGY